jgi:hypothetical protein
VRGLWFLSIATSSPRNAEAYLLPGPMASIRISNCVLTSRDLGQPFYNGGSTLEVSPIPRDVSLISMLRCFLIISTDEGNEITAAARRQPTNLRVVSSIVPLPEGTGCDATATWPCSHLDCTIEGTLRSHFADACA